jgi:hypothetical protein
MKRLHASKFALTAFTLLAVGAASSAKADTFLDYTVNGIYDSTGTVTGTFYVDATTDVVTAIDLTVTAAGGVSPVTLTTPSQFSYSLYSAPSFYNLGSYNAYETFGGAGYRVFLGFDKDGGVLASTGFGSSSIQQAFASPAYAISGTITEGAQTVSAAPEPSAWTLMIVGVAGVGGMLRYRRRPNGLAAA